MATVVGVRPEKTRRVSAEALITAAATRRRWAAGRRLSAPGRLQPEDRPAVWLFIVLLVQLGQLRQSRRCLRSSRSPIANAVAVPATTAPVPRCSHTQIPAHTTAVVVPVLDMAASDTSAARTNVVASLLGRGARRADSARVRIATRPCPATCAVVSAEAIAPRPISSWRQDQSTCGLSTGAEQVVFVVHAFESDALDRARVADGCGMVVRAYGRWRTPRPFTFDAPQPLLRGWLVGTSAVALGRCGRAGRARCRRRF
jgi:hypothetical protein